MTMRAFLTIALALSACADSIAPVHPDAGDVDDATQGGGRYSTTRGADGSFTTTLDATSATEWIHVDLDEDTEATASGPWDLRFQRFHISTNGGVSGDAGVEVARLDGVSFESVTIAPTSGWTTDQEDGDDENLDPDYAFEQGDRWYSYDVMLHVLTPRPIVWVVRTSSDSLIKLEILRYYDAAGTAGWFTYRWARL
jgi:hypothetical protein